MLQLMFTLTFSALIFGFMWGPLGAGKWLKELLRDEKQELLNRLDEAEDRLDDLRRDPHPDDISASLKAHYEAEVARLRRRLAQV